MALSNGFVQNGATAPLDARMMESARFIRTASGAVRTGVLWTSGATGNVVGSTTSMNVVIIAADFLLSRVVTDGAVLVTNNGSVNMAIATAPSSNSRIDVVWVKQNDSTQGDATSTAAFGVTTGTAAASPTKPSIPTGALELATVLVPAGVTATNASGVTISNTFQYAAPFGGPIRYRSEADMRSDISNVPAGTSAYVTGGGEFYSRGTYWTRVDATTFAVLQAQTDQTLASGTSLTSIGSSSPRYDSSDPLLLPNSGATIGPIVLSGWYRVTANVNWTGNANGLRHIEFADNDVVYNPPASDERPGSATTGANSGQNLSSVLFFNAGDYIKLKAWQNSGSTLSYRSRMIVELLRGN